VKYVKFEGTTAKDGLTMKEALTLGKIIQGYFSCETFTRREKKDILRKIQGQSRHFHISTESDSFG
jgi:hypothetical protein